VQAVIPLVVALIAVLLLYVFAPQIAGVMRHLARRTRRR
jgi:hypothetical protein